ncbi:acyl-CoA desaturase [Fluviispira multicolorata]|uniref:Acyl-CoA desaturase n=1 Tax=Fluviispira multicolorata TaxID=2654512 RepID=A0A833JF53_9BACT|nr:fatty acid desaturase [Fluviispira multicolorata]KAB8030759.1 acyl-CoA desaturase [Fluviispira multicolorata]
MKLRESASITKFNWRNFIWITAVHIIGLTLCWFYFTWQALIVFLVMHYLTGMVGITFGFHRLLSHKGFKTNSFIQNFAAFCGTLACQGGPISWVGQHRVHHAFSDTKYDPHDMNLGFWHSHIGFIFNRRADLNDVAEVSHYCPDIARVKYFMFLEKNMILIQVIVGLSLFALGGVLGGATGFDWYNAMSFIIWGVFLRLVSGYHVTWFVNSATHKWGTRPHNTNDDSRNNWWVGILAFGEGWHNNHHAQPRAARHGWEWWQFDQTWIMISTLKTLGFITDLKLPNRGSKQEISLKSDDSTSPHSSTPELTSQRKAV